MAVELYERYKNALRTGHVAVLRGRYEEALAAYREASAIAPERALPHTSLGGALLRLGRLDEALAEFDAAIERAPRDEGAVLGRAEARASAGRPADAAADLDTLAEIQQSVGRVPEAVDTLRRALELEATDARRARLDELIEQLPSQGPDALAAEASAIDIAVLEPGEPPEATPDAVEPAPEAADGSQTGEFGGRAGAVVGDEASDGGLAAAAPAEEEEGSSAIPPPDLAGLADQAEAAIAAGDDESAMASLIELALARGAAGLPDAALDAAHLALALEPGDIGLHLALVELYLERGWRELAADKLGLLVRLAELMADSRAAGEVATAIERHFADDPRFAAVAT